MMRPLLVPDLERLRRKIGGLSGRWAERWERFLEEAAAETRTVRWYGGAPDRPLHAAFAWLATGRQPWAEIARRDLLWMRDQYPATLRVGAQDLDTWIHAAAFTRRAIATDWLTVTGVLSAAEQAELTELLITDALRYPYVVLHHRVPAHANNQGLAQALHLVTVGWLFGVKHGADPRARHLLEFGLPHLLQQIALLPPGGYSGEGSTYICLVADPLMALACAILEEMTGEDWFHREFWPSRNSVEKILRLNPRLIPPSGLLPAWDQHGYHLQKAGTTAAYLAHRTGDAGGYSPYLFGPWWEFCSSFAWVHDDHVWQWLWMPAPDRVPPPATAAHCYRASWAEERVAGALLSRDGTRHLFQMWDVASAPPIRLHLNPNSLLLEAWESVLTVDGNATDDFPLMQDPRMQWRHWAMKEPRTLSWAGGSLGAHSVIVVDGDIAHQVPGGSFNNRPEEVPTGWLVRQEQRDGWQLLAAEVAPFYANRYDIRSMIRASALVGDTFWVIWDRVIADSEHEFTWQLVLRAGARPTDYGARLITAEHVVLDVFNLDAAPAQLVDLPGYPSTLEQRCHHFRKTRRGRTVEFLTLLVPQLARRLVADWTPPDYDHPWPVTVPPGAGPWLLELPRTYPARLWIDEREVPIPPLAGSHHGEPRLQPPFLDVTEHLRGRATVTLRLEIGPPSGARLGQTGSVKLHESLPVNAPRVERIAEDVWRVGDVVFRVSDLHTAPIPLPAVTAEGDDPVATGQALATRLLHTAGQTPAGPLKFHGTAAERAAACVLALQRPLRETEDDLLRCCDDADWGVRLLAIRALGIRRSRRAVPKLRQILAAETPAKIRDPEYPPKYRLKEMCIFALGLIGDRSAVPELAQVMDLEDFYGCRRLAAEVLGQLGDASVVPVLEPWVNDGDMETAAAARRALARLRGG